MTTKRIKYELPKSQAVTMTADLLLDKPLDDYKSDQVIHQVIVGFDDGMSASIEINNGGHDDNSGPYLNVNWSKDSEDLYDIGSEPDTLLGEYTLEYEEERENGQEIEITYVIELTVADE